MTMQTLHILSTLLLLLSISTICDAYVVSKITLPRSKQIEWLNTMTENLCTTAPGELSNEMLDSANRIMNAWAHMDSKECAIKVESLVKRLVDERYAGNPEATITIADYNLLLEGWARSKTGKAGAERCEEILNQLEKHSEISPNRESFKTLLKAWRLSRDETATIRAQEVLEKMIQLFVSGDNPNVCPDAQCFNIVLSLWSRSNFVDATHRAEQLVLAMERLYHATGDGGLALTTMSFNAVITAWSRSTDPSAVENVLEILNFMEKHAELGDTLIEPDALTYSTCIATLINHKGSARKAEELLGKIEEKARGTEDYGNMPGKILYNSVISCWSHENAANSFSKARGLLDRQIEFSSGVGGIKSMPDVYSFTSVLTGCATELREKHKAFQVALSTFEELQRSDKYGSPNHVTYGTMLKCCSRLLSPSNPLRKKMTRKIMTQCIEDGCVGDMAMGRFREAATPDVFGELMRGIDKKNMPALWTRNVPEVQGYSRKRKNRKQREIISLQ